MKRVVCGLVLGVWLLSQPFAFAGQRAPLYPGFPALRESKAYKKFSSRTYSEFSKILYLIDRYSDSQISINYDDQNYTALFSTTVARWFLSRNYKKQTAKQWIDQWCNKSIVYGKAIYVKLPDGKFRMAREVLMEELADLDQAVKDNQKPEVVPSPAPSAAVAGTAIAASDFSKPIPAANSSPSSNSDKGAVSNNPMPNVPVVDSAAKPKI